MWREYVPLTADGMLCVIYFDLLDRSWHLSRCVRRIALRSWCGLVVLHDTHLVLCDDRQIDLEVTLPAAVAPAIFVNAGGLSGVRPTGRLPCARIKGLQV